jgi:hypothetical protein
MLQLVFVLVVQPPAMLVLLFSGRSINNYVLLKPSIGPKSPFAIWAPHRHCICHIIVHEIDYRCIDWWVQNNYLC